jgi:hypothetical protein
MNAGLGRRKGSEGFRALFGSSPSVLWTLGERKRTERPQGACSLLNLGPGLCVCLLALLLIACASEAPVEKDLTVRGTAATTFVSESEPPVSTPDDLTDVSFDALVPNRDAYTTYAGTGNPDGTFSIPNVPFGASFYAHYELKSPTSFHQYVYTSARVLDFGSATGVRSNVAPASSGTQLTLSNIEGLSPWAAEDSIVYYALGANLYSYGEAPPIDSTALNQTLEWEPFPLLLGTQRDRLYLLQYSAVSVRSTRASVLTRSAQVPSFDMIDGGNTAIVGPPTGFTISPTLSATFDWRRSQFYAFADDVVPGRGMPEYQLYVNALAGGPSLPYGLFDVSPFLMGIDSTFEEAYDIDLGQITFGNPFPSSSHGVFGSATATFSVRTLFSETNALLTLSAVISVAAPLSSFSAGPIVPLVGPPTAIQINGQDAFTINTPVTLQPTLSWSPPTVGTPTWYEVRVRRVYVREGTNGAALTTVAVFRTPLTRLTLPPDLLAPGESYTFLLTSRYMPGGDLSRPFRFSLPTARAEAVTNLVSP